MTRGGGGYGSGGSKTCPTCRAKIVANPTPVRSLDNVIERIAATALTEEEREERKERIKAAADIKLPHEMSASSRRSAASAANRAAAAAFLPSMPPYMYGSMAGSGYDVSGAVRAAVEAVRMAAASAAAAGGGIGVGGGHPVMRDRDGDDDEDEDSDDFDDESIDRDRHIFLEHARSGRARCRQCGSLIAHHSMRFGVEMPPDDGFYESTTWFYHARCYAENRLDRARYSTIDTIPGFDRLNAAEKAELRTYAPDTS